MTLPVQLAILAAVAYLLGSIPFGLIVGKLKGVDIRQHGSRNIGATNVGRVLGKRFFWLVMPLDMLKSLLPMLAASWLVGRHSGAVHGAGVHGLWIGVGVAALLGHVFSLFLGFKGGKGVATGAGIVLGLWPYYTLAGVVAVLIFAGVFAISRYISLSSICASTAFPLAYVGISLARGWSLLGPRWPLLAVAGLIAALIILRHRDNIRRLLNGTEMRYTSKPTVTEC